MDPHLWLAGGELHVVVVVIDAVAKLHGCRQVEQGPQSTVDALVHGVASHGCHFPAAAALLSIDFSRHQNTNKPVWSVCRSESTTACESEPPQKKGRAVEQCARAGAGPQYQVFGYTHICMYPLVGL